MRKTEAQEIGQNPETDVYQRPRHSLPGSQIMVDFPLF